MAWARNFGIMHCDLDLKSWHIRESWTTIVWNIIQIQHVSEDLWPDTDFGVVWTVNLTLDVWPWVKFITHQQLCVIFSSSDKGVRLWSDTTWTDEQTDRRTDWFLLIYPKLCFWRYNYSVNFIFARFLREGPGLKKVLRMPMQVVKDDWNGVHRHWCSGFDHCRSLGFTVSQEPQCARFSRFFTCSPIV